MKCIACDCFLTETELMMVKEDGEFEDMCYECRGIAFSYDEFVDIREYHHQHLTDMVSDFFYRRSNKELEESS